MTEKQQELFTFDKFEPIKGYPELRWAGKRPFTGTSYYPAQLKETYGTDTDGWMNKIYWGDNLQVMSHLLKEFRGKVDLIYIDPPFDSNADYKKTIKLRSKDAKVKEQKSDYSTFEEKQYGDIWTNDEYLQFMYMRLILCRELLSDTGSIYLHCDWHRSHVLRCLMEEVFGMNCFNNEIIWKRASVKGGKVNSNQFPRNHDDILYFSKSNEYTFNRQFLPFDENYKKRFNKNDNDGKGPYRDDQPIGTRTPEATEELKKQGIIFFDGDKWRIKSYLNDREGVVIDDNWGDIPEENVMSVNRTDYPTQKPEALLERIIKASSNPGDIVFDCFMGSGTTQAVAMKLGRRFLGADINMGAIQTTTKRLINRAKELDSQLPTDGNEYYTGFEVYNVNNYDFYRNEDEAKRLIIKALGMQAMDGNPWDGELDGRMVAILGINRIATASEFEHIIRKIEKIYMNDWTNRQLENLNKPVEKITFVCMGHDPNLKAMFETRMSELHFKVDLEIKDILLNKEKYQLCFKREADASISIKNGKLTINAFYPMNLLQKLSLDNEDANDWKALVDSVLIDWHYDGVTFSPEITDIPDAKSMVAGSYCVPKDAGRIHIKITDLISESWEGTFDAKGGNI